MSVCLNRVAIPSCQILLTRFIYLLCSFLIKLELIFLVVIPTQSIAYRASFNFASVQLL